METWLKNQTIMAILLTLVFAGLGYGFLWKTGHTPYSPHSDIIAQHMGTKTILYKALQSGQGLPFWRDDQFSGYPAFSNPQALYTYPLHILFFFLEPVDAMGGTIWLHFAASAWVYYLLGSAMGLKFWGRLFMAVAALFNFKMIIAVYAGWLSHIAGITMFPLFFAAVFYFSKRPGLKATIVVGVTGALCLHTGHLQYFYYTIWFVAAYTLTQTGGWWRTGRWRTLLERTGLLLGAGLLGVGCAAYLLLPLFGETQLMSRAKATYAFFLDNHSLKMSHLLTFVFPEALGSPLDGTYPGTELWEDVAYFGIIPLVLAIAGSICGWRRSHTKFLTLSFFVSLALTIDSPILRLLHAFLPGFELFRSPNRFLFFTAFFGIALSGIGLEEMMTRLRNLSRRSFVPPLFAGLLLIVIAGEGIYYARRYITTFPQEQTFPTTDYQRYLAADSEVFRIVPASRLPVSYGWAAHMNLQLITGYDSFNLKHYLTYCDLLRWGSVRSDGARTWTDVTSVANWHFVDALNAKYILSPVRFDLPEARFELIGQWKNQPIFVFYKG